MSKDDPLVEFGREVRRRREALGLTLEGLAERAELTPNYIGTIENGKRDPSITTIAAIAKGLDLAPGELLGEVPELSPILIEVGGSSTARRPTSRRRCSRSCGPPPSSAASSPRDRPEPSGQAPRARARSPRAKLHERALEDISAGLAQSPACSPGGAVAQSPGDD
jgi:transcriptional regulator with XRE-family HTH domain